MSTTSRTGGSNPAGALIFLHGLGDTPAGWSHLKSMLPGICPRLAGIEYVFPKAPTIGLTINGGMQMPGWFDLYDWPIGISARDDPDGLAAAVRTVEEAVQRLNAAGIESKRIVVGGFSQGGAIALRASYGKKGVGCGGVAALSGWLTMANDLELSGPSQSTPLFWAHGRYDDKVLFEQQAHGISKLRAAGVQHIESYQYDMGHESQPDEIQKLAAFVDKSIFGDIADAEKEL